MPQKLTVDPSFKGDYLFFWNAETPYLLVRLAGKKSRLQMDKYAAIFFLLGKAVDRIKIKYGISVEPEKMLTGINILQFLQRLIYTVRFIVKRLNEVAVIEAVKVAYLFNGMQV